MSEPIELVEQELALIKEIDEIANEQYILKAIRKMNNAQVRAWRLNIMRRVQNVQNSVTGVFSEDEYKTINAQIDTLNDEIETFGAIEFTRAIKLGGVSREIRRKMVSLKNELQEKVNIEPLSKLETKLVTRIRDTQNILKEESRTRKKVEEENREIEEDNKNIETKFALFRAEARTYVENVNKVLGWVADDGHFADFNEENAEIEEFYPEQVAEYWSNWLANQEDTNSALRELPDELQDDLSDRILDEPELAHDRASLYQYFQNYCESELSRFEKPIAPVENFEESRKVPEIQPRRIKVNDIVVPHLNSSTILSGNKIPEEVVEELQSYRSGKYELTMQNADRINELAERYNLLSINIVNQKEKASTRIINQKIRELISVQNSFGSEHNSRTGQAKIKAFVEATRNFLRHTRNQQAVFEASYHEFMNAAKDLENWINRAWWQFGGQPENHHGAGAGDNSKVTREGKMKTNYSGPSL